MFLTNMFSYPPFKLNAFDTSGPSKTNSESIVFKKGQMPFEQRLTIIILMNGQHTVKIKNSSMNTAPNGRMPAIRLLKIQT